MRVHTLNHAPPLFPRSAGVELPPTTIDREFYARNSLDQIAATITLAERLLRRAGHRQSSVESHREAVEGVNKELEEERGKLVFEKRAMKVCSGVAAAAGRHAWLHESGPTHSPVIGVVCLSRAGYCAKAGQPSTNAGRAHPQGGDSAGCDHRVRHPSQRQLCCRCVRRCRTIGAPVGGSLVRTLCVQYAWVPDTASADVLWLTHRLAWQVQPGATKAGSSRPPASTRWHHRFLRVTHTPMVQRAPGSRHRPAGANGDGA